MKKYHTRPIDFTGCHPVIAEALKRGEAIKCRVWSDGHPREEVRYVVSYWPKTYVSYRPKRYGPEGIVVWDRAEPIPLKARRIMPPERAIPVLIAEGLAFTSTGWFVGQGRMLNPQMFALMGGAVDGDASNFVWPSCIIEEVEDDE